MPCGRRPYGTVSDLPVSEGIPVPSPPSTGEAIGIAARKEGDAVVLTVSGELDLETIAPLSAALTGVGRTGDGPVVLDLSGVGFADSTTVNLLLRTRFALGPRFCVARPSAFVRRLFDTIGLEQALSVHLTLEDALAAPRTPVPPAPDSGR